MVPAATSNDNHLESGYKSDCFDRRTTICKDFSDLEDSSRDECLRFFPEDMCDGRTKDDGISRCTTVIKNYCKNFVKESMDAKRTASSFNMDRLGPYEKELYKFVNAVWPKKEHFFFNEIADEDFGFDNGDLAAMAERVLTTSQNKYFSEKMSDAQKERVELGFAVLNTLQRVWGSGNGRSFGEVTTPWGANFGLADFTKSSFESLLSANEAGWRTTDRALQTYDSIVEGLVNWTPAQQMINDLLDDLPLTDNIRAAAKLANIENDVSGEFNIFAQSLSNMLNHLIEHHESLADEEFDFFLDQLRQSEHVNLVRNLAGFAELERIMADNVMWSVDVDELAMTRGYSSSFPRDRKWMSIENWTKENVVNVMSFAAHFAGAADNIDVDEMASTAGFVFFDDIVSAQQRAEDAIKNAKSSRKVYKEVVKSALKSMNVNDRVRKAYTLAVENSRRGDIATLKELQTKLIATGLSEFNALAVVQIRDSFDSIAFKNLEVVYDALQIIEAQTFDINDAFGCERGCDFSAINWRDASVSENDFNRILDASGLYNGRNIPFQGVEHSLSRSTGVMSFRGQQPIYAQVILNYLNTVMPEVEGSYGPLVFDAGTLACATQAVANLGELTVGNSRYEVYQSMMAELYLKGDENALDAIDAAMKQDQWIYGGIFVLETMLAAEEHQGNTTFDSATFNSWDLSMIDWTITGNTDQDLTEGYYQQILNGGNFVDDTVAALTVVEQQPDNTNAMTAYEEVWRYGSGNTNCGEEGIIKETTWDCPTNPDLICPGGCAAAGCSSTVEETLVCLQWTGAAFSWGINPLLGSWGMEWWEDQLHLYGPPKGNALVENSNQWNNLMDGAAQAISEMNSLGGGYSGENFAKGIQDWFDANDANNSAIVEQILNSGEYEGLDWLLTAGDSMYQSFGGNNRNGSGGANYATDANGYWNIYDMIDLVSNGGQWNMFGSEYNSGDADYSNFTYDVWGAWINGSAGDWGEDAHQLMEQFGSQEFFGTTRNSTNNIYPSTGGGGGGDGGEGGDDGGPTIIEIESVSWPIASDCIRKTAGETITAFLASEGKTDATVTADLAAWQTAMDTAVSGTFTIPPGEAHNILGTETHAASLHTYLDTQDATGASWDAFSPCMTYDNDPGYPAFIARLETQLALAELWATHPLQETDPVGAGTAYESVDWDRFLFTDDCCQINQQNTNATLNSLPGLQWMLQLQFDIVISNLYGRLDISCCDNSTNFLIFNATSTTGAVSSTAATTTTAYNAGGYDTMAPATNGSNGYGSMYGDPHVIVQSGDEKAVCFKVDDQDGAVVSLIQDAQEGLAVNGGLKQAGPNKVRLESLFVKSPSGLEIEIDCNWIILSRDGIQLESFTFEDSLSIGMDDVHLEIESLADAKKNGVYITIPSYVNDREIKMHVAIKNGKDAMRFSLRDASGLPSSGLGGIIGEAIIPRDYKVTEEGHILVGAETISNTQATRDSNNDCLYIADSADVERFLGHPVSDFRVDGKFMMPATLLDNQGPK